MTSENKQTANANKARTASADKFAMEIVTKLNEIEQINNYKFVTLHDRCVALNHIGITTQKGGEWTKTQISRVLKRIEKTDN